MMMEIEEKNVYEFLKKGHRKHVNRMWLPPSVEVSDKKVIGPNTTHLKRVKDIYGSQLVEYYGHNDFEYIVEDKSRESPAMRHDRLQTGKLERQIVSRPYSDCPEDSGELYIHEGIRIPVLQIDSLVKGILNGKNDSGVYLLVGNNSSGKTAIMSYGWKMLAGKGVFASYFDARNVAKDTKKVGGENPAYISRAEKNENLIMVDEPEKGMFRRDGSHVVGTQEKLQTVMDKAKLSKTPVILSYAGSMEEYDAMLGKLRSKVEDKWKNGGDKDLASRLGGSTRLHVKALSLDDRQDFVENILVGMHVEDKYVVDVSRAIHETLAPESEIRKIVAAAGSVVPWIKYSEGSFSYDKAISVLGDTGFAGAVQGDLFGRMSAKDVMKSVADFHGIHSRNIIDGGNAFASPRYNFVLHMRELGFRAGETAKALGRNSVSNMLKTADGVVGSVDSELSSHMKKVKRELVGYRDSLK